MKSMDYIDLLEKKFSPKNDSALADLLKVRPATVSFYKNSDRTFSDEVCIRIGKLLDIDPMRIITDMDAQRAVSPTARKLRLKIADIVASVGCVWVAFCILCKIIKFNDLRKSSLIYN